MAAFYTHRRARVKGFSVALKGEAFADELSRYLLAAPFLNLSLWERSARMRRVRGVRFSVKPRALIPHPSPLPTGEGADAGASAEE
ncbi:hypothetical protein D1F64_05285 [Breoghania sp. L-A4]|nr:hypothetical protein D1F64_05285 [Breoghania sp. L-A4]